MREFILSATRDRADAESLRSERRPLLFLTKGNSSNVMSYDISTGIMEIIRKSKDLGIAPRILDPSRSCSL